MIYFKRLDSLRFLAFFFVFWSHLFTKEFNIDWISKNTTIQTVLKSFVYTGGIGVQLFFVISGFLITYLLIKEHESNSKINIKHFYIRRILRIWPLYYLIFITGIFILPNLINTFQFEGSIWKNLCFLNNFDMENKEPNIAVGWSVAIEEQFYLFWPILFSIFYRIKLLNVFCIVAFIASSNFIVLYPELAHFHTFGNINYLMMGCLGATIYSQNTFKFSTSFLTKNAFFYSNIILSILIVILSNTILSLQYIILILPLNFVLIIIHLVHNNSEERISIFSKMGKYTYGMYLYHAIFIILVKILFDKFGINYHTNLIVILGMAIVSLSLTIITSILSYNYFEKPFLKLKSKFASVKTRM